MPTIREWLNLEIITMVFATLAAVALVIDRYLKLLKEANTSYREWHEKRTKKGLILPPSPEEIAKYGAPSPQREDLKESAANVDSNEFKEKSVLAEPLFFSDPKVAQILPFTIFMLSALISSFAFAPSVYYPLRTLALLLVLIPFLPIYRALEWRISPIAVAVGAVIGVGWVVSPVTEVGPSSYGALSGELLLVWLVFRGIGTILIVPLVEELFFRDYLESRLRGGVGLGWVFGAAFVSGAVFATLNERWAEAFVAALLFSWLRWRSGRIGDAIIAHAVAKAIAFGTYIATGNLTAI